MNKKIKMAVIGTGMAWEKLHYPALKQLDDRYEIVAMCDIDTQKAYKCANKIKLSQDNVYSDYNEMLKRDDFSVVDVLVPISENYNVAKAVLNSKKDLIAEKPLASTIEGAEQLIELKDKYNLKIMVAENFRYDEVNLKIKDLLKKNTIGELVYFVYNTSANFINDMESNSFSCKEWRQHPDYRGGSFLDGGIHDIALIRFLFGDPDDVYAVFTRHDMDYCPYASINTIFKFADNNAGSYIYYSRESEKQKEPIGLRIFGTEGEIYLKSKDCGKIEIAFNDGSSETKKFRPQQGYYNEFMNFYNGNIISTPEKEIGDIKLVFRILDCDRKFEYV